VTTDYLTGVKTESRIQLRNMESICYWIYWRQMCTYVLHQK